MTEYVRRGYSRTCGSSQLRDERDQALTRSKLEQAVIQAARDLNDGPDIDSRRETLERALVALDNARPAEGEITEIEELLAENAKLLARVQRLEDLYEPMETRPC